jgi:predicted AlkP superfamily phosphohydrolase/phosphomutase
MSARVLVVGFEAMEATLADAWVREGRLPTLASLSATGEAFDLETELDYLPDVASPEFITGRVGGSIGWYRVPKQLFSGETQPRPVRPDDVDLTAVWDLASRGGRRVAEFCVPWVGPSSGTNGLHVWGWGTHDKPFGTGSDPPSALASVRSHGEHAVAHDHATRSRCDDHGDDIPSYLRLLDQLRRGLETKTAAACDLLAGESWDLFFTAFSESHCVGHHFWHFQDESSPWHDPDAPPELRNAIRSIYEQLDDALARLRVAAGQEAVLLAFTNIGMGPAVGG